MSADAPSYVDPIINQTVFTQIDLRQHLGELLQFQFPDRFLPTFLHEITHHWCFTSPVGTALALLRMRACRRATMISAGHGRDDLPWDLLEDILRQETAQELLRAHAEGLSCFMEFDSLPGSSQVLSLPSRLAFENFSGWSEDERIRRDVNLHLFTLQYGARQDPLVTERRENVLASHFDLRHGAHLAGYMTVKGLWRRARGQSVRADDAELFACFLRAYFWEDYGLVNLLLDPSNSEHRAVNVIASHFAARFNQLLDMDLDRQLPLFAESYLRSSFVERKVGSALVRHYRFEGIGVEENAWEAGAHRLEGLLEELSCEVRLDTDPLSAEWLQMMLMRLDQTKAQRRNLICVGSLDVDVEINEHGMAVARPPGAGAAMPNFVGPTREPMAQAPVAPGSIEFYLLPAWDSRAVCVLRDHKVVCARIEGAVPEDQQRALIALFESRTRSLQMVADAEANLAKVIAADSIRIVYDQFKQTSRVGLEKFALDMIVCLVGGPVAADVRTKLASGGMFRLCNEDAALLRGLAFLGAASSVSGDRSEIETWATRQEIDLPWVVAGLKAIQAQTGYPLLVETPDRVIPLL